MATASNNHQNCQTRIDFINKVLRDHLGLPSKEISQSEIAPVQYDPDCPFKYNNFICRLTLPSGILAGCGDVDESRRYKRPGCVPIPAGLQQFILRLSNSDAEGMHQTTRVQNEVGILTLAAAALSHIKPAVVPRVFGWGGADHESSGWILEEMMPGVSLAEAFTNLTSIDRKREILAQIARLLKALQEYSLPKSIEGWGGVTFDDSGTIISAPMPSVGTGPWHSFEDSDWERFEQVLAQTNENPYLMGWRANSVRSRIDAFIEHGLSVQFSGFPSERERAIVHADFTTDNMLYDPSTGNITALLDYDFASILHPAYEFFRSFSDIGGRLSGRLVGTTSQEKEAAALRTAKLTGRFPSPLPVFAESGDSSTVDWELARAWEEELQKCGVKRPSTIEGIDKIANVDELLTALWPWRLTNEDFLRMNTDENQRLAVRSSSEKQVVALLEHMGF